MVGIIIWGHSLPHNIKACFHEPIETLNTGWTQVISSEIHELEYMQQHLPIEDNETIVLERVVPQNYEGKYLMFYAEHQEVMVYIDDVLVYSLTCPEEIEFVGSPGRLWIKIPMVGELGPKTMRLEISSQFSKYVKTPHNFYWVDHEDINFVEMKKLGFLNVAAFVIFCLAIISYVNAAIWKNKELRHFLITLADMYLITALWICTETNTFAFIFGNTAIYTLLAMILIRIMPLTYFHMCLATIDRKPWWLTMAGFIMWVDLLISLILQFVFGISLVEQLVSYAIIVVICIFICLIGMLHHYITMPRTRNTHRIYYSSSVLLVAALFETICYLTHSTFSTYSGVSMVLGCLLYACLVHISLVRKESITDLQKKELDEHYKILQRKPLTSQINAHFLGNTLNTISAYCKEDPMKADYAVKILAKYIRLYMHKVNDDQYSVLDDELNLVELYLEIQNMRFDNTIKLHVDNQFSEFRLPALCLQPIVENAVKHGMGGTEELINIEIKTYKYKGMAEILITDNGTGFEISENTMYMGVSLTNINARIQAMDGTMEIISSVGKGTSVIIRVPIDKKSSKTSMKY